MRVIFRGRRNIWWGRRVTSFAPRIVKDVSYVTRFNHESHFLWHAQYLVNFGEVEGTPFASLNLDDISYATRINHENHPFVAGAIFAEVGG